VRELSLIGVHQVLFPQNKDLSIYSNPELFPKQGAVLPSACGGYATPRSHLANEFHQIQFVNYYMSVTFFVIVKSVKKY
jgi:hypothetical protein